VFRVLKYYEIITLFEAPNNDIVGIGKYLVVINHFRRVF
jgi:hypothetical protein